MSQWDGKSKGTLLGYKIFVFCIKKLGIRTAYAVLFFVAFYYFLTQFKSNRAIFYYLHNRQKQNKFKAFLNIYKSYFVFGQTLIDKVAISAGLRNKFTYEFDGVEILKKLLAEKKGGVLISAHVGNFEIAEHFFGDINLECQINLVTTDLEHSVIKQYLESVTKKPSVKFIIVRDDLSHIFEINQALANNELICFTGDRYFEGSKCFEEELLGEKALFPAGPFLIASRLKVPVVFVYVMKEPQLHYHLYARIAQVKQRDEKGLLKAYTENVEGILKKYPSQWFNYFDFWKANL
ncbi:lipid A biosynthesis acyltransferase [Flavobacterium columnare NBRC 100251 = ATCC 23463]|uniref:LpxL/LpxP family acyltransferase n=1 Tax=Flavobacterium columnare TaxID=996 RepID=UPI0007F9C992|nr:lipid A biosynthesis acyltransferase [Flavobacterium columnare]ANO47511.1 lipid A biosynthesis acyltransferase [Flavobacterium columnare]APT21853.1 lipid A biosynthesis acyltransferase [Flavobacterium columnare]PDS26043.1 lipid A biosynthesis acyltransferase [Flavobacterium columnare NBRC 100251 = ATCC 23463]QOG89368.1 lipid A biosynthesis acyltransferase [Flavobacterium columnare]QOG92028.1 lipid A biosynthesis acyltransferase [Flavobacterium columnare]